MKEKKELISEDVLTQRVTQFSSVCDPSAHLDRGEGPPVFSGAGWLPGHHLRTRGTLDSMEKGLSSWPSTCCLQSDPGNSSALKASGIQILPALPGPTHIIAIFKHLHLAVPSLRPTRLFVFLCVDGTDTLPGYLDRNPGPTQASRSSAPHRPTLLACASHSSVCPAQAWPRPPHPALHD